MKRKATSASCAIKDQNYDLGASGAPATKAKKKAKAASSTAPTNKRKLPAKKSAINQANQLQLEQQQRQQQDGPVWIYGLINNIEQMLTQFNNKQRMQQVVQQQQQQEAALFQRKSATTKTGQQGEANPKAKSRSSARSSGYSTPSSLYSSASLSPPFSSPSSASSGCAYGSSSSSNSPVAAGSLVPAVSKKSGTELLATNNNQLPRSPISRQIKFHEYKGPPQARKPSNKQQQQQNHATVNASNATAAQTNGQIASVDTAKKLTAATRSDCLLLPSMDMPSTWQDGHETAASITQRPSSQLASQLVNPAQPQAIQVRNVAAVNCHDQMISLPSDNSSSQSLSAQQQYQPQIGTQLTQNDHPLGPILMVPSNMQQQQQQQRQLLQQQQNYQPTIQCRQHQLVTSPCNQRHQQVIQMPVSCQLIQQHQLRQQQQQQHRRTFTNQPVSIQLLRDGHQALGSNQQQVFVVDQAAFHQIQLQQQQQQLKPRTKPVTVVLHQQQFHHQNQQQQPNGDPPVRYNNVDRSGDQFPNQQFDDSYAQSQQLPHSVLMKAQFEPAETKNSDPIMVTRSEQFEPVQREQPLADEYQERLEVAPSSCYEMPPFEDLNQSADCDFQNTCDDLEPTISFESDLAVGTSSGGQPFDETLLFSEFIDLQDIPLNVDESDWLRKFLPPCSTL